MDCNVMEYRMLRVKIIDKCAAVDEQNLVQEKDKMKKVGYFLKGIKFASSNVSIPIGIFSKALWWGVFQEKFNQ